MPHRRLTREDEILPYLDRDPVWCCYALGDLEEPLFSLCDWYANDHALALIFKGLRHQPLFLTGDLPAITDLLAEIPLPPQAYLSAPHARFPQLERFYDVRNPVTMLRMALQSPRLVPGEAVPLGPAALPELRALYGDAGAPVFTPQQLETGFFFGIRENNQLIAAAGVHVASQRLNIGVIGNVFTASPHRGRGLAAIVCSRLVETLHQAGIGRIVLNVAEENTPAVRLYERLGFETHCAYREALGTLRNKVLANGNNFE